MDKCFTIIYHEVLRQFKSERAFYKEALGINQNAWEKYKSGESNFDNIKLSTYRRMMANLFTSYETVLIDEAIQAVNFNWYKDVIDAFHEIKLKHAKHFMNNGGHIEAYSGVVDDERALYKGINRIKVIDKIGNAVSFEIKYPSNLPKDLHLRMPSGKRNRKEWFDKYFEQVVIK